MCTNLLLLGQKKKCILYQEILLWKESLKNQKVLKGIVRNLKNVRVELIPIITAFAIRQLNI